MRLITSKQFISLMVTLSCAVAMGQVEKPKFPAIDLLNAEGKPDGSFEDPTRKYYAQGKLTEPPKVVAGNDKISAVNGKYYLRLNMYGGDKRRISGSLMFGGGKIDLTKGRRFRFQWHARTETKNAIKNTMVTVFFVDQKNGRKTRKRVNSKIFPLKVGKWQAYQADVVYDGEEPVDNLNVRFGFFGRGDNGRVIKGDILFDDIKIWQINDPEVEVGRTARLAALKNSLPPVPPITVNFTAPQDGDVTLVMDDKDDKRVVNLIEGVFYKKGPHTFQWDGLNNGKAMNLGGGKGNIPQKRLVKLGTYKVKGLVHNPLKFTYDMTAYPNIGKENVPWPTDLHQGEGGWLADHGAPAAAAFIPADQSPYDEDVIALASTIAEAAPAMAYVNMSGKKLGGYRRVGGDWTGVYHFATDRGTKHHPNIFLYSIKRWHARRGNPKNSVLMKVLGFTKDHVLEVDYRNIMLPEGKTWKDATIGGFAVHDGLLAFSELLTGKIYLYDTSVISLEKPAKFIKAISMPDVKALAFTPEGSLLILSGKILKKYALDRINTTIKEQAVLVKNGLDDPKRMMVAGDGRIFIADWGKSNQVKVYSSTGKNILTIGTPGPCVAGPYNKNHMNHPLGMALDSRDRLWVAEHFHLPKRVSVWDAGTGKLTRAFYGPTSYGGGGFLDPKNPDTIYWAMGKGCMSFKLDRAQGTGVPQRILYLTKDNEATRDKTHNKPPDFPYYRGEQRYITNSYSGPTGGGVTAQFWLDDGKVARPMTFIGGLRGFSYFVKEQSRLAPYAPLFAPENKPENPRKLGGYRRKCDEYLAKTIACWIDFSQDGKIDSNEIKFLSFVGRDDIGSILSANIGKDFELLFVHTKGVFRIPCDGFSDAGHPLYDLNKIEPIITDLNLYGSSGGNQALRCADGNIILTGGPMRGFKGNKELWSIHSQWPSLHMGHYAPSSPQYPGQMLATTRLLGPLVTPKTGDAGQIWAINSDKGVMYLTTADGYFLSTVGSLAYNAKRWTMKKHQRGMDVTHINYESENFFPTINQQPDGKVVIISGKTHISLIDVDGLETTKRFTAPNVVVDQGVEAQAKAYAQAYAAWEKRTVTSKDLIIARRTKAVKIDGKLDDWKDAEWVTISSTNLRHGSGIIKVPMAEGAWAVDDKNLYVAVRSQKTNFVKNGGADPEAFFSSGGGVDIRLAAKNGTKRAGGGRAKPKVGDLRLIIARHAGKPTAFLYKAKVPGTKKPITISSPVRTIEIDKIDNVSDKITVAYSMIYLPDPTNSRRKNGYRTAEIAVPLKLLEWNPKALPTTTGDIGLLLGEDGRTIERDYWHNKCAGIVSDMPSEASLDVGYWGKVKVK